MELQLLQAVLLLGFISLVKTLLRLVHWVWSTFFRPSKDLKRCYGSWALVTGAADGIGKAISIELADRGLNLILLDRDVPRLETTAKEVQERNVKVITLVSDLCKDTRNEIVRKIREAIEGLDVGVLINNAGTTHRYPIFFHQVDTNVVDSTVTVNVEAATWVAKAVLPGMMERRRGAIVNLGSASGSFVRSFPLFTVYAATKAYIHLFSTSISLEYKRHGIDVQCQAPYFVTTRLTSSRRPTIWMPTPRTFSKASVDRIGYEVICTPYWSHSVILYALNLLPTSVLNRFVLQFTMDLLKKKLGTEELNEGHDD
ncbi:hypothetical protein Sjap_006370 [Stephania japonica]|uniref:Uncharacterized protein n=1 Tax=Stephania japonica TaxID=461633 RepID=A0AAP0PJN9_9MAGN